MKPFDGYNHVIGLCFGENGELYLLSHQTIIKEHRYVIKIGDKYAHFVSCNDVEKPYIEELLTKEQTKAIRYTLSKCQKLKFYKLAAINDMPPEENEDYIYLPQTYFTVSAFLIGGMSEKFKDFR